MKTYQQIKEDMESRIAAMPPEKRAKALAIQANNAKIAAKVNPKNNTKPTTNNSSALAIRDTKKLPPSSSSKSLPPSSSTTKKPSAIVPSSKTQMVKRNTGTSAKKVDDRVKSAKKPINRTNRVYPAIKTPNKERFSDKVDKKIGNAARKAGSKLGDGLKKAPGAALRGAGKLGKAVIGAKSASLGSVEGKNIGKSATREYGDSQY